MLRAHRAPPAAGPHLSGVAILGQREEMSPCCPAEQRFELPGAELRHLADGRDSPGPELVRRHRSDSPETFDTERMEEGELASRRDDQQPIRLCDAARHL